VGWVKKWKTRNFLARKTAQKLSRAGVRFSEAPKVFGHDSSTMHHVNKEVSKYETSGYKLNICYLKRHVQMKAL